MHIDVAYNWFRYAVRCTLKIALKWKSLNPVLHNTDFLFAWRSPKTKMLAMVYRKKLDGLLNRSFCQKKMAVSRNHRRRVLVYKKFRVIIRPTVDPSVGSLDKQVNPSGRSIKVVPARLWCHVWNYFYYEQTCVIFHRKNWHTLLIYSFRNNLLWNLYNNMEHSRADTNFSWAEVLC